MKGLNLLLALSLALFAMVALTACDENRYLITTGSNEEICIIKKYASNYLSCEPYSLETAERMYSDVAKLNEIRLANDYR